ncbi:MAG TPA: IS3 family transposase [Acidimicrobiia bacterium]|nr:IS3 family transposase [Acidimicrobiia bacterium]
MQEQNRSSTARRYTREQKDQAVRLVRKLREETGERHGAVKRVADQLGYGAESVRSWVNQADVDEGVRPGTTTDDAARIKNLEQENRELRRANEILKRASGFLRGGARPPTEVTVAFIDENRDEFGVEPMCDVLQVAPSTYYAARKRVPSARQLRDQVMIPILVALWTVNRKVYGAHKLWKAARRAGYVIGRDQVARLMKTAGIEGVTRRRKVRTTRSDPAADRHPDLVDRQFTADAPNRLWTVDLTYVATWAGVAYVCFITDAFSRRIVGWRVAAHMRAEMVLDALEMARWSRGTHLEGLVAHSDAGSQFTSVRWGERLVELGAQPSIGSVGDSFDNALAETVNGLYKTELIYGPDQGPWRSIEDVELATLSWVHWYNTERLHGYLGDIPPAEHEEAFYAQIATTR